MADNVTFQTTAAATPPSATVVATDDVGGVQYQRIKLDGGGDGASTPFVAGQQARAASLPVALSVEDALLLSTLLAGGLPAALGAGGGLKIDGSGTALPVSGTVTANIGTVATLATAAKQPALGTAGTPSTDVITVQGATTGTPLPTLEQSRAAAAANINLPSSNTAAVVTFAAAGGGISNVIGGVAWSYNAAPTAGNLKVEDVSGTTVFSIDITAAGPGFIPFARPLKGSANSALIVTLAAGGSGVTGKVSVLSKWTE